MAGQCNGKETEARAGDSAKSYFLFLAGQRLQCVGVVDPNNTCTSSLLTKGPVQRNAGNKKSSHANFGPFGRNVPPPLCVSCCGARSERMGTARHTRGGGGAQCTSVGPTTRGGRRGGPEGGGEGKPFSVLVLGMSAPGLFRWYTPIPSISLQFGAPISHFGGRGRGRRSAGEGT